MSSTTQRPPVLLIAAVAKDGAVGANNALLWRLPEDMAYFREQTMGHTVVMGRKTWESLPVKFRPLPGRRNIVVSAQKGYAAEGAELATSPQAALAMAAQGPSAHAAGDARVFVIGGPQLWAETMEQADALLITEVDARYPQADCHFPDIPASYEREVLNELTSSTGPRLCFTRWVKRTKS